MKKPIEYQYIIHGNTVHALSTYAGKVVKGTAKCNNVDEFNLETGKELAAARCNAKVAKRRYQRATKKFLEAKAAAEAAIKHFEDMVGYYTDACDALGDAEEAVDKLLAPEA